MSTVPDTRLAGRGWRARLMPWKREPFAVWWGIGFFWTVIECGGDLPRWSAGIAISTWAMTWYADHLWQRHVDSPTPTPEPHHD